MTLPAATAFFAGTYDEANQLLGEMRDYVARRQRREAQGLVAMERLRLTAEAMRATTRLTHIMAWLLMQKAVHAGEIGLSQALERDAPLSGLGVCMAGEETDGDGLPLGFAALLERSRRLYIRVARLDDMVRRRQH
jgi:regulator of CtrA degradation